MANYQRVTLTSLLFITAICFLLVVLIIKLELPLIFRLLLFFPIYWLCQRFAKYYYRMKEVKNRLGLIVALVLTTIVVFF